MSMIERIHLQILAAIEQQGSLTAAAASLFLTQSALSHTIKKLEKQLGTPLWYKDGRVLRLTQAGLYLQREAKRLLPQLERLDEVLGQYASGERGELRIGMECHPCYHWLLGVVENFLQQWPKVDVDVRQQFQFGGLAALFNYEIDLLITPDPLYKAEVHYTPVLDYEQVLVVASNHPLAQRNYVLPADLSELVLYTYPVEIERLDIFKDFLLPAHCAPKKHKLVEATELMLQMVAAGRGVASLPRWLLERQAASGLVTLRLGEQGLFKRLYLAQRTNDDATSPISAFLAISQPT